MTTSQSDLFGASPSPAHRPMAVLPQLPRPAAVEMFPTPPTMPWARRLVAAGAVAQDVMFLVSWLWTGEIVEALCLGAAGRALLHKTGVIDDIKPDAGAFGRIIYLDPTRARELHATHPLIQTGIAGTHSARYRLADGREAAPADLELPPRCEYG